MQVCWSQMRRTIQPAMVYMGWLRLLSQRYGLVFDPEYFVLNQCITRLILNYAVCKRTSLLLLYLVYRISQMLHTGLPVRSFSEG